MRPFLLPVFRAVDGLLRIEAVRIAFLQLIEVALQDLLQRDLQRCGRLCKVPRDIAQFLGKVRAVKRVPLRKPFFTMSMASPDSPHSPITLLSRTSFHASSGLSVAIARF